jgi:hypothetical protein
MLLPDFFLFVLPARGVDGLCLLDVFAPVYPFSHWLRLSKKDFPCLFDFFSR